MKRISLPDEGEDGWSYNPDLIEHVIEARLRRDEHTQKLVREAQSQEPQRFKRGAVGLNQAEIASIRWEALKKFLESARLPEELRERRARFRERFQERVERFLKMPGTQRDAELSDEAQLHAVFFARECEKAIARATGEFADMLTQAVIARRGRKDFSLDLRAKLWRECLEFAMSLYPGLASEWVDRAYGHDPHESPAPHLHRLDTIADQQRENERFFLPFIKRFQEQLRHASPDWLGEADRRIALRCLLSQTPGLRQMPGDRNKRAIVTLLGESPELTTKQVCAKLDAFNDRNEDNAPIPKPWRRRGVRSWVDAYGKSQNAVEVYISKVRKQAGIPSASA